ncbi:MAG: PDZ domain-containing protein, partial [Oscillospiraceae bacterium]|nr:PDZ domain-containing protein [Oscillospiraceae bacterium]
MKKSERIRSFVFLIAVLSLLCTYVTAAKYLIPGGCTIGIRADVDGLIVTGIEEGFPASRGGIRAGDILLTVNGVPLHSAQELTEAAQAGTVE